MSALELDRIDVAYPSPGGPKRVVEGLSLRLEEGQLGCLLGASGCGKTTVLRAIAGFEPVQGGLIRLQGRDVAVAGLHVPPERRRVGMMFQDYALFPHLDVAGNVGFGLRALPRRERAARVGAMLALVGLQASASAYPHELSGGQQQRVALARALAPRPALLLLDEPFSNLDIHTRERLARELRDLLRQAGATALMVTHDQAEAFAMADRIGVMDAGRLLQWDTARALYQRPAAPQVAGFIGRGLLVDAAALGEAGEHRVLLRPEHLRCDPDGGVAGQVLSYTFRGPGWLAQVRLDSGDVVELDLDDEAAAQPGQIIRLRWRDPAPVRFPPGG
ncbi:ABC transporter ATP-binding protein [Pseudoxanthomonas mexicana]|uniref:ABC transporter ATP-binding protein n=1 Tax=Pseudoxanthomonas mexicana TaxID=128785 RepID=UPI00398B3483